MERINEFMAKPITWGGYIKLSAICVGISAAYSAAILIPQYIKLKKIDKEKENVINWNEVLNNLNKED